jgi:aryl-alcohol dehydrogenase-like predicted oxidoreductase
MKYNLLGNTGLNISALSMGTVALGTEYGITMPDGAGRPGEREAVKLLRYAREKGINFFDTAPAYGNSEYLVGKALGDSDDCFIATKVTIPLDQKGKILSGKALKEKLTESIDNSLVALKRNFLDIVQIHNATREIVNRGEFTETLLYQHKQGKIRFLGATVYGEENAMAMIEDGHFAMLQVAYSILDQRMEKAVIPAAVKAGMGIIARSVYLKGVLSPRAQYLPEDLKSLRLAADQARRLFSSTWEKMPHYALRFALTNCNISAALVGPASIEELDVALEAQEAGPLETEIIKKAQGLGLDDDSLVNPANWSIP